MSISMQIIIILYRNISCTLKTEDRRCFKLFITIDLIQIRY